MRRKLQAVPRGSALLPSNALTCSPARSTPTPSSHLMTFDLFIGIDYSGAQTPNSPLPGLQIYAARPGGDVERWDGPRRTNRGQRVNWTRQELAARLREEARRGTRFIAGIDHGLSFPLSYFERHGLKSWPEFLADFVEHWPTHLDNVYVDFVRDGALHLSGHAPPVRASFA